ncbi:MAG TPA: hypothetical protein VFS51_02305 [Gemmatimonadales bacterium]|nr:hypothetical protein [Gemmatimonadales bacterium]
MTMLATRKLRVETFSPAHVPAVHAFNERLAAGAAGWRFPEDPRPDWLPRVPGSDVFQELFLLLEGDDVRGAYALKRQPVSFRGKIRQVGNLYMPLSEGTVNRAYSLVGARLFSDAMQREPMLFALGLGGGNTLVTGLVRALGWQLHSVPFFFKVVNAHRFLRQIRYLRTTRLRSRLLDLAAFSGIGWAIAAGAGAMLTRRPEGATDLRAEEVDRFGDWADDLWSSCAACYSFASVRTSDILNRVHPPERKNLLRLKVTRAGRVVGYAVLQDEESTPSETLGEMRVGTVVDALAHPADAESVIWLAAQALESRRVDLMISNQSHPAWGVGLRRAGFIEGPSTCIFAAARRLADHIRLVDPQWQDAHLNRGDGDWPWGINLRTPSSPA